MFISPDSLAALSDSPCLLHRDRVLSYADVAASVQQFTPRLPFRRGLIAIEMAPTPAAISAYVGALQAGHAVMPIPRAEPETARRLEQRFPPCELASDRGPLEALAPRESGVPSS